MNELLFSIENLCVRVESKIVLEDFNLQIRQGECHALMGKNGSGKTSLAQTLMGHPKYEVLSGKIRFQGEEIQSLSPEERARRGLFLSFQYPVAIPGVSIAQFLRSAVRATHPERSTKDFRPRVKEELLRLQIPENFMTRFVNDGFSGGEKKKLEILQLRLLNPSMAVLDETDSGLDVDALRLVAEAINQLRSERRSFLLITHYARLLELIRPDVVHIMMDGKILRSGSESLATQLESKGYESFRAAI